MGRGEEIYPLPEAPRRYCVVAFPGYGMSTAEAYRKLRRPLLTTPATRPTIEMFCGTVNEDATNALGNDFEPAVFSTFPQLAAVKEFLLRSGAEKASLSGSGSAVFGIFQSYAQARQAGRQLRRPPHRVFVVRTVRRREFQRQLPAFAR